MPHGHHTIILNASFEIKLAFVIAVTVLAVIVPIVATKLENFLKRSRD